MIASLALKLLRLLWCLKREKFWNKMEASGSVNYYFCMRN
ncbi:hypothetical protein CDL12_21402 [Handroanthus impetiginosus]|uniref:Uncharacterized protein n=1 Tax=Handroanthus impetiginosus TaxID=429701 RepID=A0A2G9GL72_9LAMI|nr:hypothetical protein CDL12_21402 [Handroanthus impetiginosus]